MSASFTYSVFQIEPDGASATLVAFEALDEVPVVLSSALAADAGLAVGDTIAVTTETATLSVVVAGTVGYVPGHPHAQAMWADRDALRRATLSAGSLDPLTGNAGYGSAVSVALFVLTLGLTLLAQRLTKEDAA